MNLYNKTSLDALAKEQGFVRDNLEKVLRLVEILKYFHQSKLLSETLALKGGTAINLTLFQMPRLSVDIDLDFTRNCGKEEMLGIREKVNTEIQLYMQSSGYNIATNSKSPHSLDSWVYLYTNSVGNNDNIKIEINYSNRCHLFPVTEVKVSVPFLNEVAVRTLAQTELIASKINALVGRGAARDLYDVYNMMRHNTLSLLDTDLLRKSVVFYMTVGSNKNMTQTKFDVFPEIDKITFDKVRAQLLPVLRHSDKYFELDKIKTEVIGFLSELLRLSENECLYIESFNNKEYRPELLFEDEDILSRIINHPMALWKTRKND